MNLHTESAAALRDWIDQELDESDLVSPEDVAREALRKLTADQQYQLALVMAQALFADRAIERADESIGALQLPEPTQKPILRLLRLVEAGEAGSATK